MFASRTSLFFLFPFLSLSFFAADQARGEPLLLSDAVRLALAKNYTLRVAAFDPQIAQENVLTAAGIFDPGFELSYKYAEDASQLTSDPFNPARSATSLGATDQYSAGIGGLLPLGTRYSIGLSGTNSRGTFNNFTDRYFTFGGLTVEQPLLRGFGLGANLASYRIARAQRGRSEWEYRQAIMDTITQVVFLYHEVHFAEQRLKIAERSRELAASLVGENERRFRVGSMSEFDVTTARARMAEREEEILFARQAVAARRNALYQLVSDARSPEALANNQLQVAPPPPIGRESTSPAQDFKLALENRPDYQQARLSIQLGRYNRTLRANQLLPEVNFVGSYGYHGFGDTWNQSRDALETRDRRSYSAGAVLRVPLTSAQERGRYRAAKLEVKQAEAQLEMLEQNILIALANAALDIETTRKRVQATTAARELAQQALDAAQKMLRAGSASTFEVLTYQRELAAAEVAEFRARADEQKALAEYDRQIGTTLATWRVQLENPRS